MKASLCVGRYATTPYCIEGIDVFIYSMEELCYCIKENAFLIDVSLMNDGLLEWIDRECGLRDLVKILNPLVHKAGSLSAFVTVILEYTGFYGPEVIRQVEQDRLQLSELVGYEVVGMAYPCSEPNHDDRVIELIRANCGVKYARTGTMADSFDLQPDLLHFNPNLHHIRNPERQEEIIRRFLEMEADKPQILCIFGHSYEMDFADDDWARLEELFADLANRNDIFYGTMKEVLL